MDQLDLLGAPPSSAAGPAPARTPPRLSQLARRLPPGVFLGTSSWSFPGWEGLVYAGAHEQAALARAGLAAYAQHPLFRAVGVDRTFYAPITDEDFRAYAEATPAGFRFLVKAAEAVCLSRFPHHARYGARRGETNPDFLDVGFATDLVVGPFVDGLGDKQGPLVFQLPPQDIAGLGGPDRVAERLFRFVDALPKGPLYAVEVRNPALVTPRLAAALEDAGAVPCLNGLRGMPPLQRQAEVLLPRPDRTLVIRWMLARELDYEAARARFSPFDRLKAPDPGTRDRVATLVTAFAARGQPAFVIVNNKAEGCSPLSLARLAERLVELL